MFIMPSMLGAVSKNRSPTVLINDKSLLATSLAFGFPSSCSTTYSLNSSSQAIGSGTFSPAGSLSGDGSYANEWLTNGNPSLYSVRATLSSGDSPSGTFGSWLALSSTRNWTLSSSVGIGGYQHKTCSLLIEIALTADTSTILDSANIDMSAEAESNP